MSSSNLLCGIYKCNRKETNFETRCGHHFHKFCLKRWFENGNKLCPECNEKISLSETIEKHKRDGTCFTEDEKRLINIYSLKADDLNLFNCLAVYLESLDLFDKTIQAKTDRSQKSMIMGIFDALIELSTDSNLKNSEKVYQLWYACSLDGLKDPFELLIEIKKNNYLALDWSSKNLFCKACKFGYLSIIKILLELGFIRTVSDAMDAAASAHKCQANQLDLCKILISYKIDVDFKSDTGITPLMLASGEGNIKMMSWLLESGAYINIRDKNYYSALSHACKMGHVDAFEFLIAHGAEYKLKYFPNDILKDVCASGNLILFTRYLELGIQRDKDFLHYVCTYGTVEMLEKAVQSGENVNNQGELGNTELHYACGNLKVNFVDALISLGALVNCTNHKLESPIFELCKFITAGFDEDSVDSGHKSYKKHFPEFSAILDRLIGSGADLNARNALGETALFFIVRQNRINLLELLVEKDANINVVANDGSTLIHEACAIRSVKMLQKLIELKCHHINRKTNSGNTPLLQVYCQVSEKKKSSKCLDVLIKHGALIHCGKGFSKSPLQICIKSSYKRLAMKLIKLGFKKKK